MSSETCEETLGYGVSVTDCDQVSLLMKICTDQGQAGNETHSLVASLPWSQAGNVLKMIIFYQVWSFYIFFVTSDRS